MLEFLLGYLLGSAASAPAKPVQPFSIEEWIAYGGLVVLLTVFFARVLVCAIKRSL